MQNLKTIFKQSFHYLPTGDQEAYRKKIFQTLSFIALAFSVLRLSLIKIYSDSPSSFQDNFINAFPMVVVLSALLLLKYSFQISKFIGLYILPLTGVIVSLQFNDNSVQYLLLIFLLISFIIYDKLSSIIPCFIWNCLLYTVVQLNILGVFVNQIGVKEMVISIADGTIFLIITFFLLTYLKNTVNFYMKRISKDNDALIEVNSDLLVMHKELIEKNNRLENDQFNINSSNKALSKILSVIAHDIKSPLVSVRNIVNYTKDLKSNKENLVKYIPEISKTLNNTVGLLENLLQWSRNQSNQEEAKQEFINFNTIVLEVMDLYSLPIKTKKIKLEIENPTNAFVTFNKPMLLTILRNLISNAVKFTKIGGQIKIVATPINGKVKIQFINEVDYISSETIEKLNTNCDVLHKGSAGEIGSGFGLHITRDFLQTTNTSLQFSQRNNILVFCEFSLKGYINSKLKAITTNEEFSNYRLSIK